MIKIFMKLLFWVLWPLVWVYAPLRVRARTLVVCGDTFLVVKPYFGTNMWQLPGGGVRLGETTQHAAIRELYEEVGLRIEKASQLVPVATYKEKGLLLRYELFVAKLSVATELRYNKEIATAEWLPINDDNSMLSQHVKVALLAYKK